MSNLIQCSICGLFNSRPPSLTHSSFAECEYVCENCRCKDCSIVLGFECDCGERHAERDSDIPEICSECVIIRQKVDNLHPDLRKLRDSEIARENRIDEGLRLPEEDKLDPLTENQLETGETVN